MASVKPKRYLNLDRAKKRLRFWLLLFFFALSLPVYVLLDKVYSQLENETWYRQRNQAEALVQRIERQLLDKLQAEQQRPIAEYSFFNVLENPLLQSSTVNFSPLAQLPPKSEIPGLLGYFQIDPDGSFHIPALPKLGGDQQSGLSTEELASRQALKQKLLELLALSDDADDQEVEQEGYKDVMEDVASAPAVRQERFDADQAEAESDREAGIEILADKKVAKKPAPSAKRKKQMLSEEKLKQLNIETSLWKQQREKNEAASESPRKVLQGDYRQLARKETVKIPVQSMAGAIFNRNRASLSSETAQGMDEAEVGLAEPAVQEQVELRRQAKVNILSFETEVSPLQLLMLGEGHLCFYRNAWSGKSRYIQGFIVDRRFLSQLVQSSLEDSDNKALSSLLLVDRGNVLQQFKLTPAGSELLLFRRTLAAPFQQMEMIVNTASLAPGSGRMVLDMISVALGLIIPVGFLLFYRLGVGQIELAKQQRNFISSVSHELKTPLTSIRMYSEMLRAGWAPDEARKQGYYDYIYFESERLSRLIGNVLQLARMDNHQSKVEWVRVNASQLLQQIDAKVAAQIDAADYRLNLLAPENEPKDAEVKIDQDAFFQIIINLVDNAIKFSKQSDRHTIDIGYRIGERGKELLFYVRDYGPGVDKQQRKKIFKLFYRAGDELTRTQPGTGIGLALVVQLAEAMNAKVDQVNRTPGAEFQLKFKLK